MTPTDPGPDDLRDDRRLVHREMLRLGALALISIAAFAVTRAVAAGSREMALRDADAWYRLGRQQMASGDLEDAVDSLNRAVARHRGEKAYGLALADALTARHDYESASHVLLTLHEAEPEDPGISLQLARLAVRRQDFPGALKYYRQTLYADWPSEQIDARRQVRFELIALLLDNGQSQRALSELMALAADLPDRAPAYIRAATLFAQAGDHRRALDQYRRALRLAPDDRQALAGAGQSAFQLGDYETARAYLRQASAGSGTDESLEIADLVVAGDPLARRIGSTERRRRLAEALSWADARLASCLEPAAAAEAAQQLQHEARAFQNQLKKPTLEQDTVEAGVELVDRMEHRAIEGCVQPTPRDRALVLIARRHGVVAR